MLSPDKTPARSAAEIRKEAAEKKKAELAAKGVVSAACMSFPSLVYIAACIPILQYLIFREARGLPGPLAKFSKGSRVRDRLALTRVRRFLLPKRLLGLLGTVLPQAVKV